MICAPGGTAAAGSLLLAATSRPITREGAQRAAHRELSKGIYRTGQPSLAERLLRAFFDWFGHVLDRATQATPGGAWGLLGLLAVLVAVVVVIRLRVGPLARSAPLTAGLAHTAPLTPEEHRRRADEHAAAGRYAEAVRERLRAVAGELERRAILEPRPGRTADEVAAEAGAALPGLGPDFRTAARLFDDVWYGGRPATAESDAVIRSLDERARTARPAPPTVPTPT